MIRTPDPSRRVALVAAARWETPFAPEWLAYHQAIGFGHVYLTCNDDDPAALWEAVLPFTTGPNPFVSFIHHPWPGQRFAMALRGLREARRAWPWAMILDLDEFVHLPGLHDIERLLDGVETGHDAVHLHRIGFGNSGFRTRPPGGTLRNFVRRQRALSHVTRVLLRCSRLRLDAARERAPIWTDPGSILPAGARQVNALGETMPPAPRPRLEPSLAGRLMAKGLVHHYPFRSEQDFLLRVGRGVQGDFGGQSLWRELYANGEYRTVLAELNAQEDRSLADFWASRINRGARRATLLAAPAWANIGLGRPARQSSVSPWSRGGDPAEDAAGLVNGRISGGFQCHTANEERPWWELDLGAPARLHEIRVFNRCDDRGLAERVRACALSASADGSHWLTLHHQSDGPVFGGADGSPLVVRTPGPVAARFVRFTLLAPANLHLDQVEVYGEMG